MTQDPNLTADQVARLEDRLEAAAAEVAEVQAQLDAARSTSPSDAPGSTAPPGTPVPQVPYGGADMAGLDLPAYLAAPGAPPSPASVAPLVDPPRPVPFAYRLATFDLSFWELFALVIGFVAPIAVWVFLPEAFPIALVAAVVLVALFRIRRYVRRTAILKWGKVATVTRNDMLSAGTYFSGTTYNNMRLRHATGWDATTSWYSGPGYTNKVDYTLDGTPGSLKFRGLRYTDGVVLADSRKPTRAMVVSQFPYSVKPEPDGRFSGRLTPWLWGGIVTTLVVEGTLVYVAVVAVLDTWF